MKMKFEPTGNKYSLIKIEVAKRADRLKWAHHTEVIYEQDQFNRMLQQATTRNMTGTVVVVVTIIMT